MKVLIGNFHNGAFGGGEAYTYQVVKAIAEFAEVLFINKPNKNFSILNSRIWNGVERVDWYINFNHFHPLICNTATKNINIVYFPNKAHRVNEFDLLVSICNYTAKYVGEYWGRTTRVCKPYSNGVAPGAKVKNSILSIGNFFMEKDGHSKNQHVLIQAFGKLCEEIGPDCKLTLIGGVVHPEYLQRCKAEAAGLNVEFIPDCPEEKKNSLLATSEYYWHANGYGRIDPYQTEHFGIAPEEAIKAGCLTYVHNSGGAKDFCQSWYSVSTLLYLTKSSAPNVAGIEFQTPENMAKFWREVLHEA